MNDGTRKHLVLPNIENFMYKLDMVQREMGKQPSHMVPLKYSNDQSDANNKFLSLLLLAGGLTVFTMLAFRARRQKPKTGSKPG